MSAKPKAPAKLPDRENLREILAYNIQTLRVQKGWSQERLANECELDRTYVSAVERCRWNVSLSNIEKLATALSCPAWQLLKYPRARSHLSQIYDLIHLNYPYQIRL
ncbi:helix-turn-helix transcriptional regulator [Glaesserella parasuis]|nr:helix-turn-helix transcriptional regulator [Glaesserella parasuis]MCT8703814.1 helix-turn-helix transcriptional regulator [Glaesserella parasuis]MCT8706310.1 helix-turn-helix transcriptional regulator [Glaesserella parasuis]MCT8708170.1 helix-turn-helix transcriptional regulator [Glaesserella parasuis]MCT8711449.1 helix-turn-helix transcriptional regulator [Glaesserella parasuis]